MRSILFLFYLMSAAAFLSSLEGQILTSGFRLFSSNIRLEGSLLIKTIPELSLISCAIECARDQSQVAFNYNTVENSCELVSSEHNNTLDATLTNNVNYNYYVNVNLPSCLSNPCLYGSRCVPTEDGLDYRCLDCLTNFGGKNCGDLNCDSCFQKDNMLYKVFDSNVSLNYDAAFYKCRGERMRLVVIMDDSTQKTILEGLYSLTLKLSWPQEYRFWLALYRDRNQSNFSEWYWLDENAFIDSYLGKYNRLMINNSNDQCAVLKLIISSYVECPWISAPCYNPSNGTYLPFCQRDLNYINNTAYDNTTVGQAIAAGMADATTGMVQATTNMVQGTTGMGQATTGTVQGTTGIGQATTGMIQGTIGMAQAATDMIQGTTGMGQATTGFVQATTGMVQATTGMVQGTTGMAEATTGVTETSFETTSYWEPQP